MAPASPWTLGRALCAVAMLATGVLGGQVLKTTGFTECGSDASIKVNKLDISYDNDKKIIVFDISGTSTKTQNVTATLNITAYGNAIFSKSFNPCDEGTFVEQLCPVPVGTFSAQGSQEIPAQFASMVPSIAFQIPDISAMATLELDNLDSGDMVACIQSDVSNGKSVNQPVVSYIAAGLAGVALIMSGVSAAGAAASGASGAGTGSASPSFTEVASWFQGLAMNGMLSVSYPPIYRKFAKNFAFSTGLVPWDGLLKSIDGFRAKTGGNLTHDSVEFLRNATLVFPDGSTSTPGHGSLKVKRASDIVALIARQIDTSINTTAPGTEGAASPANFKQTVSGIQAFAAELAVPRSDIFMTALLVVAIVIAAIVFGILLVKHYWNSIARTVTSLILLLYGVWVLYCVFQFTLGDSWAAKTLAGVTLGLFTGVLAFFTYMIWSTVRKLKTEEGDASRLFEDKSIWLKYSMFYESYRKSYWWVFIPTIVYLLVKGCVLAAADGHGMVQSIAMVTIEALMLVLLIWSRPYEVRSGNVLNISIQAVRLLSVACILVFVEEFGIAKTTQTVTGVVLIAVQSALTITLAVLIAWNAINACCNMNPHRKRRKEMEKIRDVDDLTPLDARNSLLIANHGKLDLEASVYSVSVSSMDKRPSDSSLADRYYRMADENTNNLYTGHSRDPSGASTFRSLTPGVPKHFIPTGAPMGMSMSAHHSRGPSLQQEFTGQDYGRAIDYQSPLLMPTTTRVIEAFRGR
ncbi:Flavin carrier 1-like protein [Cladobotryum mycophilum]|uniref:Flavin carrier 1-like protein n=1 Tax=Cladobotryum mycophilum TaxID=491253 RepID=A0ABR0SF48_9HYPO